MTIVKIKSRDGMHDIESQFHRIKNWMGDEWIEVPEKLIDKLNDGYCDLSIKDGVLIDIMPKENPALKSEPTEMDALKAQITYTALKTGTLIGGAN